jgi:hypothetical protein
MNVTVIVPESGWSIALTIAQILAALGTVGALLFFWLQLREMHRQGVAARQATQDQVTEMQRQGQTAQDQLTELREQGQQARRKADEDRQDAVTPMLWTTFHGGNRTGGSPDVSGYIHVHVDGNGVAFDVTISFRAANNSQQDFDRVGMRLNAGPYGPLRPNDVEKVPMSWRMPQPAVNGTIEVSFSNAHGHRYTWIQPIELSYSTDMSAQIIRLSGPAHREPQA